MMPKRQYAIIIAFILIIVVAACSTIELQTPEPQPTLPPGANETAVALSVQQTMLALPSATLAPSESAPPTFTLPPPTIPPTLTASPTTTFTFTPTFTPTFTSTFTETPSLTPTVPSPTPDAIQLTQTLEARIQSANILIAEDIVMNSALLPRVDRAIEKLGISGGKVVNTRDASGNFVRYLQSGIAWDLVIIAAENRGYSFTNMAGLLVDHAQNNGAIILEAWNLNTEDTGQTQYLLDMCGLDIQMDWYRSKGYDPLDFYIQNASFDTGNPAVWEPNQIVFPLRPTFYWMADVGDLLMLSPGSHARLLAGLYSGDPTRYGLLASCLDGRMIVQSFSSHDYRMNDSINLWQNYIVTTLTNHFNVTQPYQP